MSSLFSMAFQKVSIHVKNSCINPPLISFKLIPPPSFSLLSAPGPVTILNINRVNGTHVVVTWVRLTLEEARGFITHYTIIAVPIDEVQNKQENGIVSGDFPSSASSGTLGGLSPGVQYGMVVVGNTEAGMGAENSAIFVPTVTTPTSSEPCQHKCAYNHVNCAC